MYTIFRRYYTDDTTRVFSEHPVQRRHDLNPDDGDFVKLTPDFIQRKFNIPFECITYVYHHETHSRILIPPTGVMLPKGGTYTLKQTPLPKNKRARLVWTLALIALAVLAVLAYNFTNFSPDWNGDVFGRTIGQRVRQYTALAQVVPLYFFPWDKVRALRCRWVRRTIVWVFGYPLHLIMVTYYTVAMFWYSLPMPPVVFDNLLLVYTIVAAVISVWLD